MNALIDMENLKNKAFKKTFRLSNGQVKHGKIELRQSKGHVIRLEPISPVL